ncbi:MAG TPA: oxygen-dependent coproporphyrinogen oxidase, partial [Bacteroidia bacterium]|nr:oxygen-dependent coproporphyrinogen oxidase [Bacteroidia bacterium]
MLVKEDISKWFMGLQDRICSALEQTDGSAQFREDAWERKEGGGGRSRVIGHGAIFEKGGVNYSAVHGNTPEAIQKAMGLPPSEFYATGVSIVLHPGSPMLPIIHMNVRYFEMSNGTWWFGGGIDLTPIYIREEDARYFHSELKKTCDKHKTSFYPDFKKWADDYFYIPHRKETRGIGGIFFDRLDFKTGLTKEALFEFVKAVGETFVPVYTEILKRNKGLSFTEQQKQWQLLRRGRYVEFNLVYDKGTK